jgi:hypothetical protein
LSIFVPKKTMLHRGEVSIKRVRKHVYDFHIAARWRGTVAVSLPLAANERVVHKVGGILVPESRQAGKSRVWVTRLSWFTTLSGNIKTTPCLKLTVAAFVKCVAERGLAHIDKQLAGWIISHLSKNCAAKMAANGFFEGGPTDVFRAAIRRECVGHAGDYWRYPTGPTSASPPLGSGGGPAGGGGSGSTGVPPGTHGETAGGIAHTWTNYHTAGGDQGSPIQGGQTVGVVCKVEGFRVADGNTWWYRIGSSPWHGIYYVSADAFYNNGETSGSLHGTPFVDPRVPTCEGSTQPPASGDGVPETAGGVAHTWTDYVSAGGTQGPSIQAYQTVVIECKVQGFKVADGNTWWYRIASSPWNSSYYVSADAFYNNGQTSGSLHGTPFVDPAVPDCSAPTSTWAETTGGDSHTWTNYTTAGGTQGPTIPAYTTVQITCKVPGFKVADGNTWWYRIASSPWNNSYYASADAFYNNGQTSGSLQGTPFVDPAVANC